MPTLRDIRRRITGVANTSKITQAMKMVSASKLRRAQEAIQSARPYVLKLSDMLGNLVESVGEEYTHPLVQKHNSVNNIAVIVVSSDRGLCGSFNTNIIKFVSNKLSETEKEVKLITIGKKATDFFKKQKYQLIHSYDNILGNLNAQIVNDIVKNIIERYLKKEFDEVQIIYNEFKSIAKQNIVSERFLPLIVDDKHTDKSNAPMIDYIYEPSASEILNDLIPKQLNVHFLKTLLESNAAEHAARMTAMEIATNNASDLMQILELFYNKARQESITKELLEIVSGAEALKES